MTEQTAATDLMNAPAEVLKLLREQAALYGRLESYSARQRTLVTHDDVGPLLALLADRQKLSQALTHVAGLLTPVRHRWSDFKRRLAPDQRLEADRLVEDAGKALQRIIAHDESDARVLSARKQTVAGAMRSSHSTSEAMSAYRVAAPRSARVDCTDEAAS